MSEASLLSFEREGKNTIIRSKLNSRWSTGTAVPVDILSGYVASAGKRRGKRRNEGYGREATKKEEKRRGRREAQREEKERGG